MATLADMKTAIASEMFRDDAEFPTYAEAEIRRAISFYQPKRFYFNETRSLTFNTVAAQEFYDTASDARIPNLVEIDYIQITQGGGVYDLTHRSAEALDSWSNVPTSGAPSDFAYYERKLRLYPIPNAIYPVRVAGLVRVDAPATTGETGNVWMNEAEELIRSRAKRNLYAHYLADLGMAQAMATAETEALQSLRVESSQRMNVHTVMADPIF